MTTVFGNSVYIDMSVVQSKCLCVISDFVFLKL